MTEERKRALKQLLNEAMDSLEIRRSGPKSSLRLVETMPSFLSVNTYRKHLEQRWTTYWDYSDDSLSVLVYFKPNIVSEVIQSKLLNFIREEFSSFIREDRLQSASSFITDKLLFFSNGFHIDEFLEQLLKITVVQGVEGAVSAFNKCTKDTQASFQAMALLEGIRLNAEIQIFEGIRLVPLPNSSWKLPVYLSRVAGPTSEVSFLGKTVIIIEGAVSPIFHQPFPELLRERSRRDALPFRVEVGGENFSNFKMYDFYKVFCQALSLVCNYPIQIALIWKFLAEDELFNLSSQKHTSTRVLGSFGGSTEAGKVEINEAKRLYNILINLDSSVREKLLISINRWIQSKTDENNTDKMIDLGIAFESLYLSGIGETTELSFRFRLHAAWHLGKDKEHRKALMTEFREIYDWRSSVVHTGKLPKKKVSKNKRKPYTEEEVVGFLKRAQDLCRQSIMKILEEGQFPNWNDLILGGEMKSDIIALDENPGNRK